MSKRAVLYARVSGDDRHREGRNLAGQIEMGMEYAQDKGYRVVAELAEDDRGVSGADWNLPKLNEALEMARAGELDVLVVRELDRFARGLAKQLVIEGEFKRHGVEVEYILAEYDDTPEGKLNKHIRAVIAEFEREKINQRMIRGRRRKVKAGHVMVHGKPPYGYQVEEVNGKTALVICEPEARIVRLIFTWYTEGDENGRRLGLKSIAKKLTKKTVPTWADTRKIGFRKKRGWGEWTKSSVSGILSNTVYTGVWHYNKNGNPRDHWLAVEVPAIISSEMWEKAQAQRVENKAMARRNTKGEYLVGRRVTCGQCTTKMSGRPGYWGSKEYRYYYCPTAVEGLVVDRTCEMKYFRSDKVDAAVWEWVEEILQHPEALRDDLKEQQAERERENQPIRDRLAVLDDLLAENRRQLEKLLDLYLGGDFSKEVLTERKARLETTIAALEKERADLMITLESQTLTDAQIMAFEEYARKVASNLEKVEGNFKAKRQLIDELDVRVKLTIENGQKIARVSCLIREEEETLSIEDRITGACGTIDNDRT